MFLAACNVVIDFSFTRGLGRIKKLKRYGKRQLRAVRNCACRLVLRAMLQGYEAMRREAASAKPKSDKFKHCAYPGQYSLHDDAIGTPKPVLRVSCSIALQKCCAMMNGLRVLLSKHLVVNTTQRLPQISEQSPLRSTA